MNNAYPPAPAKCSKQPLFRIGKDRRGHWVVQDESGLLGGLFVDRPQALTFALVHCELKSERGRPGFIIPPKNNGNSKHVRWARDYPLKLPPHWYRAADQTRP